jgi:hypothetical protein
MAGNNAHLAFAANGWLLASAWLLYLASLVLPTLYGATGEVVTGIEILYGGWVMMAIRFWEDPWGLLAISSWLTNFVFWISWLIYRRIQKGRSKQLGLFLPACVAINISVVALAPGGIRSTLLNGLFENPGYYLWLASFVLASAATWPTKRYEAPAI